MTGDGIPELIYNDGLYEVGCKVWDLFDTDKTYEVKDIRKNHIDRLKLQNITIDGENIIYDIDAEDWQINSFTGKINNTDLTDTDSYSIRPDNIVSEFKIFYDTSNKKVAMKFDIDITNVTATEKVMTCTVFLEYDKENDTVVTQKQQIYAIEAVDWSSGQ